MNTNMTLTLAERNVPRYTSYPPVPYFSPAVGVKAYRAWLAELAKTATLSLYLHVPYCRELCFYCGCNTKAVRRQRPVDAYADLLAKEIELVGEALATHRLVHLHWGGGTPSILGAETLIALAD